MVVYIFVMATGIVAIATARAGMVWSPRLLLALSLVACPVVWLLPQARPAPGVPGLLADLPYWRSAPQGVHVGGHHLHGGWDLLVFGLGSGTTSGYLGAPMLREAKPSRGLCAAAGC